MRSATPAKPSEPVEPAPPLFIFAFHLPRGTCSSHRSDPGNLIPAVFHAIVTLSAPFGRLPLEGKAVIREYHLLKKGGKAATKALNLEP